MHKLYKRDMTLDITDRRHNTPLHIAAISNNLDTTRLLTEEYALAIDARNLDGKMAKDMGDCHPEMR